MAYARYYPGWVNDFVNKEFSSSPRMEADGQAWCNAAKKWMKFYLMDLGVNTKSKEEFIWHTGHYEWSCFFLLRGRWFYCSSGDCRFKISNWMLFRTANGPKDYTGGRNQQVYYNSTFVDNFRHEIMVHF